MNTRLLSITHVTKYGRFRPGVLGPVTGIQHDAVGIGVGTCRVCRRTVIRGAGRWWAVSASGKDRRWPDDPPPVRYTHGGGPVRDQPDATLPLMPGGESTSARLRRIEQELAEARAELAETLRRAGYIGARFNTMRAERNEARVELEQERDKSGRYAAAHRHACTMLAAAVQERNAARAKAAQLYADLAVALDELEQAQAATNDKEKNT